MARILDVIIKAKNDTTKAFKSAEADIKRFSGVAKAALGTGLAMLGVEGIKGFFREILKNSPAAQAAMTKVKEAFGGFAGAIGDVVGKSPIMKDTLARIVDGFKQATQWTDKNREAIAFWASVVVDAVSATGRSLWAVVKVAYDVGLSIGFALKKVFYEVAFAVLRQFNAVPVALNGLIDAANRLPGVNIKFRFPELSGLVGEVAMAADEARDGMVNAAKDIVIELKGAGRAWLSIGDAALKSADAAEQAADRQAAALRKIQRDAKLPDVSLLHTTAPGMKPIAGAPVIPGALESGLTIRDGDAFGTRTGKTFGQMAEQVGEARDGLLGLQDALVAVTQGAALNFGDAMTDAFAAMVDGSKSAGAAFKQSMLSALSAVAKSEGMHYLARALGAIGDAILFGNPKGLLAAAKYTAAASAFFAVAGASAGGASGGSSSGGSGTSAPAAFSASQGAFGDASRGRGTITINGGLINARDPDQLQSLKDAIDELLAQRVLDFDIVVGSR